MFQNSLLFLWIIRLVVLCQLLNLCGNTIVGNQNGSRVTKIRGVNTIARKKGEVHCGTRHRDINLWIPISFKVLLSLNHRRKEGLAN
jgi:hypothetical protein